MAAIWLVPKGAEWVGKPNVSSLNGSTPVRQHKNQTDNVLDYEF